MKKILSFSLATIFLVGINALAYGAPAEMATGGGVTVPYLNMQDHIEFDAHETSPDGNLGKGSVSYSRLGQFTYQFDVKYARVVPAEHVAWFAGQVTESSTGENLGRWMSFAVCDEDSEKCATDMQGYQWIPDVNMSAEEQEAIALEWVQQGLPDPYTSGLPVVEGNITVH